MRSRASSLPDLLCLSRAAALPPAALRLQRGAQIIDQRRHGGAVVGEFLRAGIEFGDDFGHWLYWSQSGKIVGQSDYPTIWGPMTMGDR